MLLRGLPDKFVNIELKDKTLKINSENIHYTLLVYESDQYPNLSFQHEEKTLQIECQKIQDIILKNLTFNLYR